MLNWGPDCCENAPRCCSQNAHDKPTPLALYFILQHRASYKINNLYSDGANLVLFWESVRNWILKAEGGICMETEENGAEQLQYMMTRCLD